MIFSCAKFKLYIKKAMLKMSGNTFLLKRKVLKMRNTNQKCYLKRHLTVLSIDQIERSTLGFFSVLSSIN